MSVGNGWEAHGVVCVEVMRTRRLRGTRSRTTRAHTRGICYLSLTRCLLRKHSFDLDVSKTADGSYVIGHPVDLERLLEANEAITVRRACLLQASCAHCGEIRSAWE